MEENSVSCIGFLQSMDFVTERSPYTIISSNINTLFTFLHFLLFCSLFFPPLCINRPFQVDLFCCQNCYQYLCLFARQRYVQLSENYHDRKCPVQRNQIQQKFAVSTHHDQRKLPVGGKSCKYICCCCCCCWGEKVSNFGSTSPGCSLTTEKTLIFQSLSLQLVFVQFTQSLVIIKDQFLHYENPLFYQRKTLFCVLRNGDFW